MAFKDPEPPPIEVKPYQEVDKVRVRVDLPMTLYTKLMALKGLRDKGKTSFSLVEDLVVEMIENHINDWIQADTE